MSALVETGIWLSQPLDDHRPSLVGQVQEVRGFV